MLASGAGFVLAAWLLLACLWSSYVAAAHLFPRAPVTVRLCAQLVIAWYGLVACFFGLASFGGFRPWIALPLGFAIGIACAFGGASAALQARADLAAAAHMWRGLDRIVRAIAVAFGVLLFARLARGLVAPPLAWDALTYHFVHAARFVQAGGFVRELAPDNWSYYEFFPTAGEVLWAWAMLPLGNDALLAPAGVGVLLATFVTAFGCARSLDVSHERATLMAISVAGSPALLAWATSGYVDNVVVALTAAGSLFIIRNGERPSAREAALAMAAFGLAGATKLNAFALVACAMAALSAQALMAPAATQGAARRVRQLALAGLPACVLLIQLGRTWLATGNPLYPFAVDWFGADLFDGNAEWQWRWLNEMGQAYQPPPGSFKAIERAVGVFWPFGRAGTLGGTHLGFGPAGAALLALAPIGWAVLLARRERRVAAVFLAAVAGTAIYAFTLSPFSDHLQHFYSSNPGRYLGTALVACAVLASVVRFPAERPIWSGIAIATLVVGLPMGLSAIELPAAITVGLALLGWIGLFIVLCRNLSLATPFDRTARATALIVAICVLGAGISWVRDALRFRVYSASAERKAFDGHPLWPEFASSWTIWEAVDQLPAQRIAVSTGWAGLLHNGYRYPLFGSRLQHELVYVAPTRSGEIVDYRLAQRMAREADLHSWLARLIERDVTLVVTLAPDTMPESAWAKSLPRVFSPLATSAGGRSHAYRFNCQLARAELA